MSDFRAVETLPELMVSNEGNRQKVGLVQAFMHEPDLLILDEPTSGLDPLVQQTFLDLVREAKPPDKPSSCPRTS
ncbi:hypothetical protein AB0L34_32155 [Micromonospora sp. NPDC052213]|uniref:ATP-binding cassette domain-containing protein n=1 Tax=Micromonospora sp. NPDC052213 TaxID=3155812 RepID=UPI0034414950